MTAAVTYVTFLLTRRYTKNPELCSVPCGDEFGLELNWNGALNPVLSLILLSSSSWLVSNGNNITSSVSLTMKVSQILTGSTILACRIGVIVCVFQGGKGKSEANATQTRGEREARVACEEKISKKSRLSAYHCSSCFGVQIKYECGYLTGYFKTRDPRIIFEDETRSNRVI